MSDQKPPIFTRRDLCEAVFRHRKIVVLCPLAAIALGVFVILYFPRTYRSEAQVFLRLGRENIGLDPTVTTGHTVLAPLADRKDEVLSVIDVIKSRGVVAQGVDRLGADFVLTGGARQECGQPGLFAAASAPMRLVTQWLRTLDPISDRERAIIQVEKGLSVHADRGSMLISISYDAKSPAAAQRICSAIVDVYQEEHMRIHRSQDSRPFFAEQRDRLQQELDHALDAVRAAKNEMGLSTVEQRRASLEAQFNSVELALLATQQQLSTSQAEIADLDRQLAKLPERLIEEKKSVPNSGADLLRQQLYALQVKSMDLQARYSDAHPLVQSANDQVKEAQQVLAAQANERMETTDSVNPIFRQLSLALKQQQSRKAGLASTLDELSRQRTTIATGLRAVNDQEVKIDQLNRQVDLARSNFLHYAQNMEEARIDQELETEKISNLSVVQPATLAERPVSPSKPLVALAAFLLATAGTAAVVLTSEVLNDRLRSEDDIERELELPVLGSIPGHGVCRRVLPVTANGVLAPASRIR